MVGITSRRTSNKRSGCRKDPVIESLNSLGIEPEVVPEHRILDRINALRRMLDRSLIDPVRCALGLEALRNYVREWSIELRDGERHQNTTGPLTVRTRWVYLRSGTRSQASNRLQSVDGPSSQRQAIGRPNQTSTPCWCGQSTISLKRRTDYIRGEYSVARAPIWRARLSCLYWGLEDLDHDR